MFTFFCIICAAWISLCDDDVISESNGVEAWRLGVAAWVSTGVPRWWCCGCSWRATGAGCEVVDTRWSLSDRGSLWWQFGCDGLEMFAWFRGLQWGGVTAGARLEVLAGWRERESSSLFSFKEILHS